MTEPETADVISTEPVTVDITSVDSALSDMWRKASEGIVPGISTPLSRVLLLNMVVLAATDDEADEAKDVITEVSGRYPARAVIADTEPATRKQELEADVSMLCSIGDRGRRLCGEEIRLHAHELETAVIGSILPILSPDLPTYLWTPGELVSNGALTNLVEASDYWIIDTRKTSNWTDTLNNAISHGAMSETGINLNDLSWAAVAHWREIIASHFDDPLTRNYLNGTTSVEIEYGRSDSRKPRSESIMITAWLMERLDWHLKRISVDDNWNIELSNSVTITLKETYERDIGLKGVIIRSEIDGKEAMFTTKRVASEEICVEADSSDFSTNRTVRAPSPTLSAALCRVLDLPGRDILYYRSFNIIQDLMRWIESQV